MWFDDNYYESHPDKFLEDFYNVKLFFYQRAIIRLIWGLNMIHREYHTCDKCGKRLREGYTGYHTVNVYSPYSMSPQELEEVRAGAITQAEEAVDGSVKVSFKVGVFAHKDEYELCSSCTKRTSKVIKEFITKK